MTLRDSWIEVYQRIENFKQMMREANIHMGIDNWCPACNAPWPCDRKDELPIQAVIDAQREAAKEISVNLEREQLYGQPATTADPHARRSDPASSHEAVRAIARNVSLREEILTAAKRLHPQLFDDTDLLELVEQQTGRRQQRNVIARTRGLMEHDGLIMRVGLRDRINSSNRVTQTVHFRLPEPGE